MQGNATSTIAYQAAGAGLGSLFTGFVMESLTAMLPWLIAMFAIILCDLLSGIARCVKTGVNVRFSKAVRDTMWKSTVYFFCIVAACMVELASYGEYGINRWACLSICFIEGCSIMSNILKWHGYTMNFNKLIGIMLKKRYDIDMMDSDGIIEKDRRRTPGRRRRDDM